MYQRPRASPVPGVSLQAVTASMSKHEFTPKLLTLIRSGISGEQIRKDIISGFIVGIVALPLAIAFAIASGVGPEKGLITAIVAGLVISIFGGSRIQIGGPTGAFIVIVFGIVQQYGVEGLTIATFIAGFLIMAMGFLRLGRFLQYFPFTLIVGFTSGIAVIIFTSQVNDLLGLGIRDVPPAFHEKWMAYVGAIGSINPYAFALGVIAIVSTLFSGRVIRVVPGSLIAILLTTALAGYGQWPVDTIGSTFGPITGSIPFPRLYMVEWDTFKELIHPAVAIALLGAIESLLSAVVADGMIGGRHKPNMELVAQGGANILSAMFGGIPATGAIARTATNAKNGGRTPIAGIIHALVLLTILLVASPLAARIPLAALAGILMVVAWNMSELHTFVTILRSNRYDVAVLLVTFFLTVFFDLVLAIEMGMVLASFLFMKRMADSIQLNPVLGNDADEGEQLFESESGGIPPGVAVFQINGPLFFGAAQRFYDAMNEVGSAYHVLILRMRYVPLIDATGRQRLVEILKEMKDRHVKVMFSGVNDIVREEILATGLVGEDMIYPNFDLALQAARREWAERKTLQNRKRT